MKKMARSAEKLKHCNCDYNDFYAQLKQHLLPAP